MMVLAVDRDVGRHRLAAQAVGHVAAPDDEVVRHGFPAPRSRRLRGREIVSRSNYIAWRVAVLEERRPHRPYSSSVSGAVDREHARAADALLGAEERQGVGVGDVAPGPAAVGRAAGEDAALGRPSRSKVTV